MRRKMSRKRKSKKWRRNRIIKMMVIILHFMARVFGCK
jgi:hypothetical protein